jgi:hypothetical protein
MSIKEWVNKVVTAAMNGGEWQNAIVAINLIEWSDRKGTLLRVYLDVAFPK